MAFRTNKMPVLQTKSASGSVATFNTALAMPLSSCNIAVNAWQEGSGDPSPSNVRAIHGFSEVNATRAGKNLLKVDGRTYAEPSSISFDSVNPRTFAPNSYCYCLIVSNYYNRANFSTLKNIVVNNSSVSAETTASSTAYSTICLPIESLKTGATYKLSALLTNCELYASFYKADGTYISGRSASSAFTIPNETKYTVLIFRASETGVFSASNIQLEFGSTATAYEPYVTPTIYTIQLGQEVYGAEVDVVNGVVHCTWTAVDMGSINYRWYDDVGVAGGYYRSTIRDKKTGVDNIKSEIYQTNYVGITDMPDFSIKGTDNSRNIYIRDSRFVNDVEAFRQAITGKKMICELAEPFDIQLTPTQIETLIGNNTIFADTGDVDLTYKDLDIAKRGNFREVFKLPS